METKSKTMCDGQCFAYCPDGKARKARKDEPKEVVAELRCKLTETGEILAGCNTYQCPFYKPIGKEFYVRIDKRDEIRLYSPSEIRSRREFEEKHKNPYKVQGYWRITTKFRRVYD